jgi:predicted metal-dependent hydrolase
MGDDMVIFTRVFDLLEWLVPKGERFPRAYRHSVTARLLAAALDLPEQLYVAQSRRGQRRLQALADADASLNKLRLYLRLAHRWQWLSDGQYQHVSRMVAEIGRLLGGWIRQAGKT